MRSRWRRCAAKAASAADHLDANYRRVPVRGRTAQLSACVGGCPRLPEAASAAVSSCLRIGKLSQLRDLRLAAWAHMLGFRGHFSTKSRGYSIILGALRADRAARQCEYATAAGLQPDLDPGTTLVITDWHYAGRGNPTIDLPPSMGGAPCPGSL
jgi:hypothetical protein